MKIKYVFANGEVSETEVSEELGSFITDSRREESNSDRRHRYHCISLNAIDCEGTEFGTPDFSDEILDELDNRKECIYEAFSHLTEIQQRRLTMLASGLSEREIARREKVNIRAVVVSIEGARKRFKKYYCGTPHQID